MPAYEPFDLEAFFASVDLYRMPAEKVYADELLETIVYLQPTSLSMIVEFDAHLINNPERIRQQITLPIPKNFNEAIKYFREAGIAYFPFLNDTAVLDIRMRYSRLMSH